jgi:hypothetical protein
MDIIPSLFDFKLSDASLRDTVSKQQAEGLFNFFRDQPLFNWANANNGCEGRADAVCVLLDAWGIPNYKAWAFSAAYLRNGVGNLIQGWKYHVAPVLSVTEGTNIIDYVLDPSMNSSLVEMEQWANDITLLPHSYYCIRNADWYIFPAKEISKREWNRRDKQNRKWMIQCLAGINSLSTTGKAHLCFSKNRLKTLTQAFERLKHEKPV